MKDINYYFTNAIKCIEYIIDSDFYNKNDKKELVNVKVMLERWHRIFNEKNTLKEFSTKDIEYLDLEITDFFSKYITTESVRENYAERLLYYFGHLTKYWKNEMLVGE